jgi:phosphoribosyl 1,2-cyclic phosphodiesterase
MTRVFVLGSGSGGNAFAVETAQGVVLVEAGFPPRAVARRAAVVGLDLARVEVLVITHEHGDHASGAVALARRLDVPVACTPGTWTALGAPRGVEHLPLRAGRTLDTRNFAIDVCATTHDAADPVAVSVTTVAGDRVAVATDIGRPTASLRYLLREARVVVLESNYDDLMLRTGRYPRSVQHRIAGWAGHLSNRTAANLLAAVCHDGLSAVVLAHLSRECNTPTRAREVVEPILKARGFAGELLVAGQDRPLPPILVQDTRVPDQGELALR